MILTATRKITAAGGAKARRFKNQGGVDGIRVRMAERTSRNAELDAEYDDRVKNLKIRLQADRDRLEKMGRRLAALA